MPDEKWIGEVFERLLVFDSRDNLVHPTEIQVLKAKKAILDRFRRVRVEAELHGRLHEIIAAFRAGAIDAEAYSKRHGAITAKLAELNSPRLKPTDNLHGEAK